MSALSVMILTAPLWAARVEITSENLKTLLENRNAVVASARLEAAAAAERRGSLARSFLPSLDLHAASESFKLGRSPQKSEPVYGVEARVNLFNGGRDRLEDEGRALERDRREFQTQRVTSEELEKARSAYWSLLFLREKMELIRASLEVNKQNLQSALRRIRSGVATDSDRFEFEMKDVELRQELATDEVQSAQKARALALALGEDAGTEFVFKEKFTHEHEYEALLKHESRDHEFLYKEKQLQGAQAELRSQSRGRAWWPRVEAYAAYNQFNEREKEYAEAADRTESVVGLRATLSFADGWESRRESAALAQEAAAAAKTAEFQKREVEAHLDGEFAELKLLHDQVHEAEENITRAERYYKLTQSEYGRGVKNSPDVLGASEKLFEMKHKRLEILRDFQVAKAHVLSKIGK